MQDRREQVRRVEHEGRIPKTELTSLRDRFWSSIDARLDEMTDAARKRRM